LTITRAPIRSLPRDSWDVTAEDEVRLILLDELTKRSAPEALA